MLEGTGFAEASCTQWELLFARHHGKRLSVYPASSDYSADQPEPTGEDPPALQARSAAWLFGELGLNRRGFSTPDQLGREVLGEGWPQRRIGKPVLLPFPSLGDLFTGRDSFLDRVHASLMRSPGATAVAGKVEHGLGGVGKTRLVVEYGWRHLDEYTAVLFVEGRRHRRCWRRAWRRFVHRTHWISRSTLHPTKARRTASLQGT